MTDMKAYLAQKYMTGPKADAILSRVAPKKKKRKAADSLPSSSSSFGSFVLRDEDGGWPADDSKDDGDDLAEAVVEKDRGFKKRKIAPTEGESSWVTLDEGVRMAAIKEETPPQDEQPMVVETTTPFIGGLVSAQQLKKVLPQNNIDKMDNISAEDIARAQETIYRDAQGKKIDTKAARAEAARLKREREEKEAQKMEWGKGLVQREERDKQRQELERQRGRAFARHADDKDLNEDLKAKELWNDPAAAFLSKKKTKGPRRPEYNGPPPPPNRFGIRPGYRWDGVDRGNGFEKKLFQTQNARKRRGAESYQWSVDDM